MNLRPWPWLIAAGIVAVGMRAFVRAYPEGAVAETNAPASRSDSSLPPALRARENDTGTGAAIADTGENRNPFHVETPPHASRSRPAARPQPRRQWTLTGTVDDVVAMIIDSAGVKHLLRVGESVGGATLIEVNGDHARLRDAGGEFEIGLQP